MVEEISRNLFRAEIPLPRNPLKYTNSYIIKSSDRNLIIDTGFNRQECVDAMQEALDELEVDLSRTDLFVTHLHADHFGLVGSLATETSKVYFNQPDADRIHATDGWDNMIEFARISGFPEGMLDAALDRHPGHRYHTKRDFDMTILDEGDKVEVGDYALTCVHTPGHTRGHMCLYEADKRTFFSGDHILIDITPNIQLWSETENPLEQYLTSLDKVSTLDIDLVLPGHRRVVHNCKERIQELKDHHRHRADEAVAILKGGALTAYEVAGRMSWDIDSESWEDFPVPQQWFATGEAIAHLKYLEDRGEIQSEKRDGKIVLSVG
jgi:glyoxylase-like metal-dependent hydrolase (beta-lactamase superfamily II)